MKYWQICFLAFTLLLVSACDKSAYLTPDKPLIDPEEYKLDQQLHDAAKENHDAQYCNIIKTERIRNICYHNVAVLAGNMTLCGKAGDDQSIQGCYMQVSVGKLDVRLCEQVTDQNTKDLCVMQISQMTSDPSHCLQIHELSYRDNCFSHIARNVSKAEYCAQINDITERGKCNYDVAGAARDVTVCDQLKLDGNNIMRNVCVSQIARLENNQSYCDLISIKDIQTSCNARFLSRTG
jgi:hypothetical protein